MTKSEVTIYCDGACLGNPGPGGYAAILLHNARTEHERVVSGNEASTTNNRMELMGAIAGLRALKRPCEVTVFCDSLYVVKGMTEWMKSWQKSGFKNSKNKEIANIDLWQQLLAASEYHLVKWRWVRGHSGNELNDRVDEIAREQAGLAYHQLKIRST